MVKATVKAEKMLLMSYKKSKFQYAFLSFMKAFTELRKREDSIWKLSQISVPKDWKKKIQNNTLNFFFIFQVFDKSPFSEKSNRKEVLKINWIPTCSQISKIDLKNGGLI
jgi:hypothetical protein